MGERQTMGSFSSLLQDGQSEGDAVTELQKRLEISGLLSNSMHIIDEMEDKELIQQALRVGGKEAVSNMQVLQYCLRLSKFYHSIVLALYPDSMLVKGCAGTPRPLDEISSRSYNFEGD